MNCCEAKTLELRVANIYMILVSLLLFMAALFSTAILPQILLRYLYAGQKLTAEPKLLEMIPLVSFGIATLYFLYALVVTTLREMKIKRMKTNDCQHDRETDADLSDSELAELEAIVDEAISSKSNGKSKNSSRKIATNRKTSKAAKRKTKKA